MNLTEKRLDSRLEYNGGFIEVFKDNVQLPDGSILVAGNPFLGRRFIGEGQTDFKSASK